MGTGKTFLTLHPFLHRLKCRSKIIDHLSKDIVTDSRSALAYFYCDGNDSRKQDLRYILGSFIRQLLPKWSALSEDGTSVAQRLHETHKDRGINPNFLRDLEHSVQKMISIFSRVYLVIDGMDEIAERQHILSFVNSLQRSVNVHLLVVSRPLHDIEKQLSSTLRLNIEANLCLKDIQTYIQWRLNHDQKLKRIKPSLKKTIHDRLVAQSMGMLSSFQFRS